MSTHSPVAMVAAVVAVLIAAGGAHADSPRLGQPLDPTAVPAYARHVLPDGTGLPAGAGTAAAGREVYEDNCAVCHGETGREGPIMPLVGPVEDGSRPAGRHWRYATTLFDYIRRAMPFPSPKSLSDDEVYAVTAYLLFRNGVIGEAETMGPATLPKVAMPDAGLYRDWWLEAGERPY